MARGYGSGIVTGVAISLAATLLAPLWRPAMSRWGRPAAKAVIKQGVLAYELVRERAAEAGETVGDLVVESQFELASERLAETEAASGPAKAAAE